MPYPWKSRFVYGTGGDITDWTTSLPARPWARIIRSVGGSRTAAGGVPASHVVRRDYLLAVTLRLTELETVDLAWLIAWGQSSEYFLWYPDADDETESYAVYLEHPVAGEDLEEQRSAEFPSVIEATIVLRRILGAPWPLDYFACEEE